MNAESVKITLDLLLTIGTVTGMVYAAWKFILPLIRAAHGVIHRLEATVDVVLGTTQRAGIAEQLEELRRQLNSVVVEVRPNGGNSMNDAVTVVRGELRALLDADLGTARWSADRTGRLTWASRAYTRWTGSDPERMYGYGWLSLVHPDDRDDVRDEWMIAIEERRGSSFRFRVSDGSGHWLRVFGEAAPILNGAGNVTGWLGTLNRTDDEGARS